MLNRYFISLVLQRSQVETLELPGQNRSSITAAGSMDTGFVHAFRSYTLAWPKKSEAGQRLTDVNLGPLDTTTCLST